MSCQKYTQYCVRVYLITFDDPSLDVSQESGLQFENGVELLIEELS